MLLMLINLDVGFDTGRDVLAGNIAGLVGLLAGVNQMLNSNLICGR